MSEDSNNSTGVFPKKYMSKLPTGFADEITALKEEEIKAIIVQSEKNIYAIEREKNSDEKLNGAKALVKDLAVPYNEAKVAQTAKIKYCLYTLENRGIAVERDDKEDE